MTWTNTYCVPCRSTYDFYKRNTIVPPCPRCGWPQILTRDEWRKAMGIKPKPSNPRG